jgi:hypothetical protein
MEIGALFCSSSLNAIARLQPSDHYHPASGRRHLIILFNSGRRPENNRHSAGAERLRRALFLQKEVTLEVKKTSKSFVSLVLQ